MEVNKKTGDHMGCGTAEYVERASALEAMRFSPLLGFIEVKLAVEASNKEPLKRRSRFDEPPPGVANTIGINDLGPFEAALFQREQGQLVPGSTRVASAKD